MGIKLFKKKDQRPTAINQGKLVEKAIEIDGVSYYRFVNLGDMPNMRYFRMLQFSVEVQMRADADTMRQAWQEVDDALKAGDGSKIARISGIMQEKLNLLTSTDAMYRLLSCVFFTKDEYLDDYDFDIGDKKVAVFKKENIANFFFHESARKFVPLTSASEADLLASSMHEKELNNLLNQLLNSKTMNSNVKPVT